MLSVVATLCFAFSDDEALCRAHTVAQVSRTWRQAAGVLKHPYLVPSGPYEQCWDWDSVFLGTATLSWGSQPYLAGSMANFFAATNLSTGAVTGCLTRTLPTVCSSSTKEHDALSHAKPILIQGAWIAASAPGGSPGAFKVYSEAMEALLAFWDRPPRRDPVTNLRTWHDQMETGADNCVLSQCPNHRSKCWTETQAFSLASADAITLLHREHISYALFREAWASDERLTSPSASAARDAHLAVARRHREIADSLRQTLNEQLWRSDLGYHVAYNVSTRTPVLSKTYVMAYPLWAGLINASQAAQIAASLSTEAMLSSAGLRSTSSDDPRYNNDDIIVPYSNWRGPMWVNANALACYGLADYGYQKLAIEIATRVTSALAADLRTTGTWHEAYSTADKGAPLAGPGFLSWDTLGANLLSNLRGGVNPFRLA